jgi:cytochrome c-type biogenesis protein CcmH/NrfG
VQQRRDVLPDVGVEAETLRPPKKGGGAGMVLGLLLVLAGLGGAAGYYFVVWLPEQQRAQETRDLEDKAKAEAEAKLKEEQARQDAERAEAEKKAQEAAEAERKKKEDEAAKAAPPVPDAGAAVVKKVPALGPGEDAPDKPDKPEKPAPKKSADYYISQGDRLRDKERAEAALDAYGKALEISPENVEALTGKGLCLLDMAKPAQAEPVLEHALKLNARYAPAIMGLAESYRFQGKKESAIATYQKYLDTFPNGPEVGVAKANIERLK